MIQLGRALHLVSFLFLSVLLTLLLAYRNNKILYRAPKRSTPNMWRLWRLVASCGALVASCGALWRPTLSIAIHTHTYLLLRHQMDIS